MFKAGVVQIDNFKFQIVFVVAVFYLRTPPNELVSC